ncbi:MAG: XRE family transcriptional regulator [Actinomycetota bacterium]|jgi:transcriptional regulator with XRE-family HTH domain|nr:helix-turn-helix transcriptional regulator [Rubrobacter sp.]MDQ3509159.1 XRE family transcriptional regulator [Actinomycetota bacterium]
MNERYTSSRGGGSLVEAVSSGRLGVRVKEFRRSRGMTLEKLSGVSGVSRAMISKLERGEKSPTLVVAAKLAEGFGVSLSQLVGIEEKKRVAVVRKESRMVMRDPETDFERHLLSPSFGGRGVEFIKNIVSEGGTSGEFPAHREGVEEYISVEKGRMRAEIGGEEVFLEEGDSIFFEADVPQRFENAGEGECHYYLVIDSKGS